MTFDFWVTQRWLLNGSAANSNRTWSRYHLALAVQHDSHQRGLHCRSSHWEATASLVFAVLIHWAVNHRNRRRKFVAATRRSRGWHQTAVMIGKRELIAKARKRKSLKLWQWVDGNGQMSLGCRQLGVGKVKGKTSVKEKPKMNFDLRASQFGCSFGGFSNLPTVPFQNAFGPSSRMIFLAASITPE